MSALPIEPGEQPEDDPIARAVAEVVARAPRLTHDHPVARELRAVLRRADARTDRRAAS